MADSEAFSPTSSTTVLGVTSRHAHSRIVGRQMSVRREKQDGDQGNGNRKDGRQAEEYAGSLMWHIAWQ